jgi:hypothetical protein
LSNKENIMHRIFTLMTLLITVFSIHAKSLYVAPGGNNTTGDGSSERPWATISKAVGSGSTAATVSNNHVADPLFMNAANHDYHLQATSPAVNGAAGSDVARFDFDGISRSQGEASDIGAFEYHSASSRNGSLEHRTPGALFQVIYMPVRNAGHLFGLAPGASLRLVNVSGKSLTVAKQAAFRLPASAGVYIAVVR